MPSRKMARTRQCGKVVIVDGRHSGLSLHRDSYSLSCSVLCWPLAHGALLGLLFCFSLDLRVCFLFRVSSFIFI